MGGIDNLTFTNEERVDIYRGGDVEFRSYPYYELAHSGAYPKF